MTCRFGCDRECTLSGRLPAVRAVTDQRLKVAHLRKVPGELQSDSAADLSIVRPTGDRRAREHRSKFAVRSVPGQTYRFHVARSFGVYEGTPARTIVMLKFEGIEPLREWFARQLEGVVLANGECLEADMVVPVPLHWNRQEERGYNQVEQFARPLSKRLGIPFRPVFLMRTRQRPGTHLLGYEERWEAVRGAFAMKREGRVDN